MEERAPLGSLSSQTFSHLILGEGDLPKLIENVVKRTDNAQMDLIEAIPLFVRVMSPDDIRNKLTPFIRNWIDFGDKNSAVRFAYMLPYFMPPYCSTLSFLEWLFPLNMIIKQSAMFIEEPMLKLCERVTEVFDMETIESFFLTILDQLFAPGNTDSQGLAIRMQAHFAPLVQEKWRRKIKDHIYDLASQSSSAFVRTRVLSSMSKIIQVLDSEERPMMIEKVLIPAFTSGDSKVRAAAVATAATIGESFFSTREHLHKLIETSRDKSWGVRFAFVENFDGLINSCADKELFLQPILTLAKDTVHNVRSLAIHKLAKTINEFDTDSLSNIALVFDSGIRAHQEDIRIASIELWAQLLKHHPDGPFHKKIRGALNLIKTVPIESVTYQIMYNVVPLIHEFINTSTLKCGLGTLLNAVTPSWRMRGLQILSRYISHESLKEFAVSEVTTVFQMGTDPAFCVRCALGELLVDCTKELGWDWFMENVSSTLFQWLETGTSLIKQSAMRTVTAFMHISPPEEILTRFRGVMDKLVNDSLAVVQRNAIYCSKRCPM